MMTGTHSHQTAPGRAHRTLRCFAAMLAIAAAVMVPLSGLAQDTTSVQADTVIAEPITPPITGRDTVLIESYAKHYDPAKAILYAAVLPGLGQVYNKKYWKLPLVYGGFYAIGYGLDFYNDLHEEYRGYLFQNLEERIGENSTNPNLPHKMRNITTATLRNQVDRLRRERDFMIILMGGMYILQMIDAHVDAHLKEFDLNPRLQVSLEPSIDANHMAGRTMGLAVVVRF